MIVWDDDEDDDLFVEDAYDGIDPDEDEFDPEFEARGAWPEEDDDEIGD